MRKRRPIPEIDGWGPGGNAVLAVPRQSDRRLYVIVSTGCHRLALLCTHETFPLEAKRTASDIETVAIGAARVSDAETSKPSIGEQTVNGAKLLANVVLLPGTSQIVEGNVMQGIAYAGGGLVARGLLPSFLGPLGWLVVALDSYTYSVSGKHLWQKQAWGRKSQPPGAPTQAKSLPE